MNPWWQYCHSVALFPLPIDHNQYFGSIHQLGLQSIAKYILIWISCFGVLSAREGTFESKNVWRNSKNTCLWPNAPNQNVFMNLECHFLSRSFSTWAKTRRSTEIERSTARSRKGREHFHFSLTEYWNEGNQFVVVRKIQTMSLPVIRNFRSSWIDSIPTFYLHQLNLHFYRLEKLSSFSPFPSRPEDIEHWTTLLFLLQV